MKPQEKSPNIENMLNTLLGVDRKDMINANVCVMCNRPAVEFSDALSEKEFSISGLCAKCQDKMFGGKV
jgi:hypothetical protein